MQMVKRVGFWLAVAAFSCCMMLFAVMVSLRLVVGTPSSIKTALEKSGLYGLMAGHIVQETKTQVQSATGAPADDPGIEDAIATVVTPELVQQNIEIVIDSLYLWLRGHTDTPEFTLDLTKPKENIAVNLAEQGAIRIRKLPACTPEEAMVLQDTGPYTLTCQPPIDLEELQAQYVQEIMTHDDFSAITNLTAADLTTSDGTNIFANAQHIPKAFQTIQMLVWLLLVLTAVFAFIAILLHPKTKQAITGLLLGMSACSVPILILGASTGNTVNWLMPQSEAAPEAQAMQNALRIALANISGSISRVMLLLGGATLVMGILGLVLAKRMKQPESSTIPGSLQPVPNHPIMGVDGRVYFVPDQPQPIQNPVFYQQPLPPQAPPTPQVPNPPASYPLQPPAQPLSPPYPGEKKWWE